MFRQSEGNGNGNDNDDDSWWWNMSHLQDEDREIVREREREHKIMRDRYNQWDRETIDDHGKSSKTDFRRWKIGLDFFQNYI